MKLRCLLLMAVFFSILACNNISTFGSFKIDCSDDKIKAIKTYSDGLVYIKDYDDENTIKIFPNSIVEIGSNNQYILKSGAYLVINKRNKKYSTANIEDNIFLENVFGGCQFYRIKLPDYFKFTSSNIKIRYYLNGGIKNIDAKLHLINNLDKNNYYGFFIPLISSWKFDEYSIFIELFDSDSLILKVERKYSITKKDFQVQTVLFNRKKSREIASYNKQRYIQERDIRNNIYIEDNELLFSSGGYYYPLYDIQYITSEFSSSRELRLSNGRLFSKTAPHSGIDYAQPKGTNVLSAADGLVRYADYDELFGKTIVIEHGLSLFTIYSHLDIMDVKTGSLVKKGEVIGKVGETGSATGPHLHWEARIYGVPVDPRSFIMLDQIFIP